MREGSLCAVYMAGWGLFVVVRLCSIFGQMALPRCAMSREWEWGSARRGSLGVCVCVTCAFFANGVGGLGQCILFCDALLGGDACVQGVV